MRWLQRQISSQLRVRGENCSSATANLLHTRRLTLSALSPSEDEGPFPSRRSSAMEEMLTCSRSPFSQVFGRQGQLMQASEC